MKKQYFLKHFALSFLNQPIPQHMNTTLFVIPPKLALDQLEELKPTSCL
jgi:hypothetical protein